MDATDLTHDAFLGGRIHVWQPRHGYRAGVDPVLLAASIPAKAGQTVLELGCGVGTASLCLAARVPDLAITGIELQAAYAALAQRNAAENSLPLVVKQTDLRHLPADVRNTQFQHVMMNPPYFDRDASTAAPDPGRDIALGGDTPLSDWLDIGLKRLAPKGVLTLIMRIERLPQVLGALDARLGSIVVRPIVSRTARPPERFLLQGIHSGRAPFSLQTPIVMHDGDAHTADTETYSPAIRAVLRDAAKLDISS